MIFVLIIANYFLFRAYNIYDSFRYNFPVDTVVFHRILHQEITNRTMDKEEFDHKEKKEKLHLICANVRDDKWWRFCRLFLKLPKEIIETAKRNYISMEEMYTMILDFGTDRLWLVSLLERYQMYLQPRIYSIAVSQNASELEISKAIYELIHGIPLELRREFVNREFGRNLPSAFLRDSDVPYEVKMHLLRQWCEDNENLETLNLMMHEAEISGLLKQHKTQKTKFVHLNTTSECENPRDNRKRTMKPDFLS